METLETNITTIKMFLSSAFGVKWDNSGNGYTYGNIIQEGKYISELNAIIKTKDQCISDMMKEIDHLREITIEKDTIISAKMEYINTLITDVQTLKEYNKTGSKINFTEDIELSLSIDRVEKIKDLAIKLMAFPHIKPRLPVHKAELYRWYIQQAKIFIDVLFEES